MVSSCVIGRRNAAWTDYRGVKVFLSHALFGWSRAGTYSTERKKRANCLSVCWMCETIWDFSPRSTIRAINDSWEIFRRHFHMLRSLVPPEFLAVTRRPRHSNKWEHSPSCLVGINTGERGCPPAHRLGSLCYFPLEETRHRIRSSIVTIPQKRFFRSRTAASPSRAARNCCTTR